MGLWGAALLRTAEPADQAGGCHRNEWKDHGGLSGRIDTLGRRFEAGRDRHDQLSLRGRQVPSHHTTPESLELQSLWRKWKKPALGQ